MAAMGIPNTVSDAGHRRTAWTLGLCFLAALAEGFDVQSMGVAAPRMAPTLALTRDQLGPVFSASIVGLLVGAVLIGRLADRVGRRWTLIGSLVVLGVFSWVTVWAWDLRSLLVIRLLAGLGLGGAMPNLIALSAESVGEARRPLIADSYFAAVCRCCSPISRIHSPDSAVNSTSSVLMLKPDSAKRLVRCSSRSEPNAWIG